MKATVSALTLLLLATAANAADIEAGKAKVQEVCAACHGAGGVSVSDTHPQPGWPESGLRREPVEGAEGWIAQERHHECDRKPIERSRYRQCRGILRESAGNDRHGKVRVAAASGEDRRQLSRKLQSTFIKYHTINFPATRQVRYYYMNPTASQAAKEGKPLPNGSVLFAEVYSAKLDADKKPITGSDGFYAPDQLLFYTAMARDAGWGKDIPEMLRNEDWNYAVFTNAKQLRDGVNQAECLACHKPLDKTSYTFTLEQITAAAKAK